jgi:aryl-alcohol dehydrogenase
MEINAALASTPRAPFATKPLCLTEPRIDEVLLRIVATTMCHADIECGVGNLPPAAPVVLGPERAGIDERFGSAISHVVPGDHVVLTLPSCGIGPSCRERQFFRCGHILGLSLSGVRLDGRATLSKVDGRAANGCLFGQSSFASHVIAYGSYVL